MAVRIDANREGLTAPRSGGVEVRGPGAGDAVAGIGRSLSNFAQPQLNKHIQEREQQEAMADRIEIAKAGSAARLDWQRKLREDLDAYDGSAPGFAEGFTRQYAEDMQTRLGALPERIRKDVELDMIGFGERVTAAALEGESGKRDAYTMKGLLSTLDAEAMTLLDKPDDLPGALGGLDRLSEAAPAALRDKFREDGRRVLTGAYVEAKLRDDPADLLQELTDGLLDDVLDTERKARYLSQAQAGTDKLIADAERAAAADLKLREQNAKDLTARVVAYYNAGLAPPAELLGAAQDAAYALEDGGALERMKLAEYRATTGGGSRRNPATPDSFKTIEKALDLGVAPSPDLIAQAMADIEADPTGKLGDRLEKIAATAAIRQGAALMPQDDLEARIAELKAGPAGEAEVAELDVLTKVKTARDRRTDDDNLGWVSENGVTLAPVSLASQTLVADMATRARDARLVARETGAPVQVFTKAERTALTVELDKMGPDEQARALGQLTAGAGDLAGPAIRELGAKRPAYAQAGYLVATGRGQTALDALRGLKLLETDKGLLPKSKQSLENIERDVLAGVLPETAGARREAVISTARGLLALYARENGMTADDFSADDHEAYRTALQQALGRSGEVGGTGKVGKSNVWLPANMTAPEMKGLIERMSLEDWKRYSLDGTVRPIYADGSPVPVDQLRRASLVSVGEGQYQLKLVDPRLGSGGYVLATVSNTESRPYVLDLSRANGAELADTAAADRALREARAASERRRAKRPGSE